MLFISRPHCFLPSSNPHFHRTLPTQIFHSIPSAHRTAHPSLNGTLIPGRSLFLCLIPDCSLPQSWFRILCRRPIPFRTLSHWTCHWDSSHSLGLLASQRIPPDLFLP